MIWRMFYLLKLLIHRYSSLWVSRRWKCILPMLLFDPFTDPKGKIRSHTHVVLSLSLSCTDFAFSFTHACTYIFFASVLVCSKQTCCNRFRFVFTGTSSLLWSILEEVAQLNLLRPLWLHHAFCRHKQENWSFKAIICIVMARSSLYSLFSFWSWEG